jgi:hypothetical protein
MAIDELATLAPFVRRVGATAFDKERFHRVQQGLRHQFAGSVLGQQRFSIFKVSAKK